MRIAITLACVLTGCVAEPRDDGYPSGDGGWGSGWGGGGGYSDYGCQSDSECGGGGLVCARNHECLDASLVRTVRTTWTLRGDAASEASCASAPDLAITFTNASDEMFGFAPVPCRAGKFTVDKLPWRFGEVILARATDYETGYPAGFNAAGNATIDLPY